MTTRRLLLDIAPLKRSRDFRYLMGGQCVSILGTQLTTVAVPFQVYLLTRSSLDVGLASLAQLVPLMLCSLLGGSVIDSTDRRRLLIIVELIMAAASACLAINADLGTRLWPLFVFPAISAGLAGFDSPTRNAMVPRLVGKPDVPVAAAIFQSVLQVGTVIGPAVGGLLLAGAGVHYIYWIDAATFLVSIGAAARMSPQPPTESANRPGLRSIVEGFSYMKGRQGIQGAYLIDLNAMIFGMPRALFPALALTKFGGGATTLGFLYAGPGVGALVGALTAGWVTRIRSQGRAVVIAVIVWGAAIAIFGTVPWLPLALVLLAIAGWADVLSAVFRNTIVQLSVPDRLRGRFAGLQTGVVQSGPKLGDLEAGGVADALGIEFSIVSGGIACIIGALFLARALPGFRRVSIDLAETDEDEDEQDDDDGTDGTSDRETAESESSPPDENS